MFDFRENKNIFLKIAIIMLALVLIILVVLKQINQNETPAFTGNTVNDALSYTELQKEYNALTISGKYISVNDAVSLKQNLKINISSDETKASTIWLYKYGSNLLDISKMLNENLVQNEDGTFNFNFSGEQFSAIYNIFIPAGTPVHCDISVIEATLSKNFVLQLIMEDDSKEYLYLWSPVSSWKKSTRCQIFEKNVVGVRFVATYGTQVGEHIKFSQPKLNAGHIQPYADFVKPQKAVAKMDGTVDGIINEAADITLITNNSDTTITCEYFIKKAQYDLFGKTIVNFGDSIFGNYFKPTDVSSYIADLTNANVYNVGFGGCRMAKHITEEYDAFGMYWLAQAVADQSFERQDQAAEKLDNINFNEKLSTLKAIDFNKVDIITIAYGTNDFAGGVSIKDFKKALADSIETISKAYPHIKIVVCTPIYRFWMDENGKYINDSETRVVKTNRLTDFAKAVNEVAQQYGLSVIDNYNNSGINGSNKAEYFSGLDGTHPNAQGRLKIAENMAKELYSTLNN